MKRNYAPFAFHAVIQTERDHTRNHRTLSLLSSYLVDPEEKLFLESSAVTDEVLLGINDLPGDDVFRAGGGGVFRLLMTGDFSFKIDEIVGDFSLEVRSGVRSRLIGKLRSTGVGVSIGDWERLNKGFLLSSSIMFGDLDRKLDRLGDFERSL